MTRFVVIDTNVVVSGTLRGDEATPPKQIVQAMIGGHLRFLLSNELLREYRRVLLRPLIAQRHGLAEAQVDALLLDIVLGATMRELVTVSEGADRIGTAAGPVPAGDIHIAELLRTMSGSVLVTGDRRLAEVVGPWCETFSPADFAATLPR